MIHETCTIFSLPRVQIDSLPQDAGLTGSSAGADLIKGMHSSSPPTLRTSGKHPELYLISFFSCIILLKTILIQIRLPFLSSILLWIEHSFFFKKNIPWRIYSKTFMNARIRGGGVRDLFPVIYYVFLISLNFPGWGGVWFLPPPPYRFAHEILLMNIGETFLHNF